MLINRTKSWIERWTRQADEYVKANYVARPAPRFSLRGKDGFAAAKKPESDAEPSNNDPRYSIQSPVTPLDEALKEVSLGGDTVRALSYLMRAREKTFSEILAEQIEASDRSKTAIYKAAGLDRRLFSKILNDRNYKPSKDTCVALALALHLTSKEADKLLEKAGYALSDGNKRDLILAFFFRQAQYDMFTVNAVLERLGEKPLGKLDYGK